MRGGKYMKINDFKENEAEKKEVMNSKLKDLKLENIRSLWYFVNAKAKIIMGSKG